MRARPLTPETESIMTQGFAQHWSARRIAQSVLDATGVTIPERTVCRRANEYYAKQARFETARQQYAAMKAAGLDGVEMLQALAFDHLIDNPDSLTGADPVAFHDLGLRAEQLALKKHELALRERTIAVAENKMRLLESREQRAIAILRDDKGEHLSAEERVNRAMEVYGLQN